MHSTRMVIVVVVIGLTWWHDVLSESRLCKRRNGVAVDVASLSLDGQSVGQAQQAELGCAVVSLAKVAVNPCGRTRHDDSEHGYHQNTDTERVSIEAKHAISLAPCSCINSIAVDVS